MRKNILIPLTIAGALLMGCKEEQKYPTDKKYWDTKDYSEVIREIKYNTKQDEKLPTFDNPKTKLLLEKLTDEENFNVVLNDDQLGIKHRSEVAQSFFDEWRRMSEIYTMTDRTDKYVYEKELIEIWNFGLELQLKYFQLGNEAITERADDPNADQIKALTDSNINTMVSNMTHFLDEINKENSFTTEGHLLIAKAIDKNFTNLVSTYPDYNFSALLTKTKLLLNKTQSDPIRESLKKLEAQIESTAANNQL